ncbi:MAG: hypothetical protein O9340_02185 [Cyclobacteriaceae bacterium]|nr:hypothetical protein [Cyclobacteriaceae bacterium]
MSKIIFIGFAIFIFLSTEVFSCSCSRALRNSFLSNINRFEVVARGTIVRMNSDAGFEVPFLKIKKLYRGNVIDSTIQLLDGGLDCRHIWITDPEVEVVVGLFTDKSTLQQNVNLYYSAGCITSVLVLEEENRLTAKSRYIDYAGQVRNAKVSMLNMKMKLRRFERKVYWKTIFHKPKINLAPSVSQTSSSNKYF